MTECQLANLPRLLTDTSVWFIFPSIGVIHGYIFQLTRHVTGISIHFRLNAIGLYLFSTQHIINFFKVFLFIFLIYKVLGSFTLKVYQL